jgi:glutamyl-tRNA synthetase
LHQPAPILNGWALRQGSDSGKDLSDWYLSLGMTPRVRYAPSPTGSPHVGNIRTALYDHLFARGHGGTMILRIEDTDRSRYKAESETDTLESLRYVGIEWQEGLGVGGPHAPYRQSERKEAGIYQPFIDRLVESGAAYWAFETPEELDEMRLFQQVNKQPRGEVIVVQDVIRGRSEFDSDTLDDPVLIKADGMPTYHFAAMVDDHLMDITHVFRGEEWISSAPKHVVLWKALGASIPELVHLPVIKGKDGKKLSKRHGDTACLDFRRGGYLGEALANFIALIGWSPGEDREIMSLKEMEEAFSLKGIQPSSGVFDLDKLNWLNGSRLRSLAPGELRDRFVEYVSTPDTLPYWEAKNEDEEATEEQKAMAPHLKALLETAESDPDDHGPGAGKGGESCRLGA